MKRWTMAAAVVVLIGGSAHAVEYTWTGAGGDGRWGTTANWSPSTGVPGSGDDVMLPETRANAVITLEADHAARSITFDPVNHITYTLEGKSLTLDDEGRIHVRAFTSGLAFGERAMQQIACDVRLAGRATIGNDNRWFLGNERLMISGNISGTQALTLDGQGGGCVGFAGDNTNFSGPIILEKCQFVLESETGLGSSRDAIVLKAGEFSVSRFSVHRDFLVTGNASWSAGVHAGPHTGTITVRKGVTWAYGTGGNSSVMHGTLVGEGDVVLPSGHGTTLGGVVPNTLGGTFTLTSGLTILAKAANVDAVSGPLVMQKTATLRWNSDEQVADRLPVRLDGTMSVLDLSGHRETLGTLDLHGTAFIDCGDGADVLQFADSHEVAWDGTKELVVRAWGGSRTGGGSDRIVFGNGAGALTSEQLACLGFRDPAGFPEGLYTAAILDTGEIVPAKPVQPVDPPYELSPQARAERTKLYGVPGLADLSGKGTPLRKGMKISFYGDSITWNRSYLGAIEAALDRGEGTKDLGVALINHGVNGGGVLQLRDGDEGKAHFGGTKPRPFAETLAEDKPDVVVVFIGINDVWWRNTTPEVFEKALTDLVTTAKADKVPMVLTTLGVWGDHPSNERPQNVKCDAYSEIVRKVAAAHDVTLADLRKACVAYLMNHNGELKLDGSLRFAEHGVISGDGVHLDGTVPAAIISRGIHEALQGRGR